MHQYGKSLRIKWDWKLFRRFGYKRICNNQGYWTDWYTPVIPGLWLVNFTEGPP